MADLGPLIDALMSPDNATRAAAEAQYEQAQAQPDTLCAALTSTACNDAADARRSMSAVLLRKLLGRAGGVWPRLQAGTQAGVKTGLLYALTNERAAPVRAKVGHAVAELAAQAAGASTAQWPELLPAVFALAASPAAPVRAAALTAFTSIVEYVGHDGIGPHAATLGHMLPPLLGDADALVGVAALKSACAIIESLDADDAAADAVLSAYKTLVPLFFRALERSFSAGEEATRDALQALIEVLTARPHFFRAHLDTACSAMLAIIAHGTLDDATRKLAMEFLLVLADCAGATVRKLPRLIESILGLALNFLLQVGADGDDAAWCAEDDDPRAFIGADDEDASELVAVGAEACDRLAQAVGGKVLMPTFDAQVKPLLASTDWRARRAGLLAIALVAEGARRTLAPKVRDVAASVVAFFNDPHPRVRHAAARAIGQLAIDFGEADKLNTEGSAADAEVAAGALGGGAARGGSGAAARARASARVDLKTIQAAAADIVLPALVTACGAANAAAPRIRGIAAAALINFLQGEDDSHGALDAAVAERAPELMRVLVSMLQELPAGHHASRAAALSAVACVAGTLEEGFTPYYAALMPGLKSVIKAPIAAGDAEAALSMRGKALECLSVVCEAVGKEMAGVDAAECLNFIIAAVREGFSPKDSESFKYYIGALARLASCLGADFAPYIGFTVPFLLEKANQAVKHVVTDADDAGAGADDADDEGGRITTATYQLRGEGQRKVALDSAAIEEKQYAISTLNEMVDTLGVEVPAFHVALPAITESLLSNAVSVFPTIRAHALMGLSGLLIAAMADARPAGAAGSAGGAMLATILPFLAERLAKDASDDAFFVIANAIEEVTRFAYESTKPGYTGPEGAPPAPPGGAYAPAVLPLAAMPALFTAVKGAMTRIDRRRAMAAQELRENPDADDEDLERFQSTLSEVDSGLSDLVDSVGYCIKTHREAIVPFVGADLGPDMLTWLDKKDEFSIPRRVGALCLADDLIEFAGAAAAPIFSVAFPHFVECASSENSLLRHPAVYGLGLCAQFTGAAFDPHVAPTARLLARVLAAPDARSEEKASGTDNVLSSLVKIAKFRGGSAGVDSEAIMAAALKYIPLKNDAIEARLVHGWLVDGVASADPLWMGAGGARGRELISALGRALFAHERAMAEGGGQRAGAGTAADPDDDEDDDGEPLFEDATLARLPGIAAALKAGPMAGAVATVIASLSRKVQEAMSHYGF